MTQVAAEVHGSVAIPEAEHRIEPTSQSRLDDALAVLDQHKNEWLALDIDERIDLLEQMRADLVAVAEPWVEASIRGKRMTAGTVEEGEEWLTGPAAVLRNISLLITSLGDIRDFGVPQLPKPAHARPDGQVVAPVLPANGWDGVLFQGFSAEVWMDPSVTLEELQPLRRVPVRVRVDGSDRRLARAISGRLRASLLTRHVQKAPSVNGSGLAHAAFVGGTLLERFEFTPQIGLRHRRPGAEPFHDSRRHLSRRRPGEGEAEDLRGIRAGEEKAHDALCEDMRLAGTGIGREPG